MNKLPLSLLVLPLMTLALACGEPAGADESVQGGLTPKGSKIDKSSQQIVAPNMIQSDVKKIVAPNMIQGDVKKIVAPNMIAAPDMIQKPTLK